MPTIGTGAAGPGSPSANTPSGRCRCRPTCCRNTGKTIGTGGGSIAWIDRAGHLKVGPRSAGAEPGPICYPNGGTEPTITDANLVLGRIPPALIGGGIALDAARARAGLAALSEKLRGA